MKIEDAIEKFLEYIEKELNYSLMTVSDYKSDLIIYKDYLKIHKLNYLFLDKNIVINYLKYLDDKKYSNKSISRNLSALRSFYNFLTEIKLLENNIFKRVKNPKVERKLPNFLNIVEIETILDNLKEDKKEEIRNKCVFEFLYSTGLRVSELSNIKLKDFDLNNKTIRLMGKGSKERIAYFGESAKSILEKYLHVRNEFLVNGDCEYLFINKIGGKLSRSSIEYIISKISKESGVNHKLSPHTLRHTYATHLLDNGANIRSVQELLGHENLNTTEIYTHVSNDRLRNAYLKYHPNKDRE